MKTANEVIEDVTTICPADKKFEDFCKIVRSGGKWDWECKNCGREMFYVKRGDLIRAIRRLMEK